MRVLGKSPIGSAGSTLGCTSYLPSLSIDTSFVIFFVITVLVGESRNDASIESSADEHIAEEGNR